jgi:hypothetical protein
MTDKKVVDWLLEGEPWVQYITRIDLLNESPEAQKKLKTEVINHPQVQEMLDALYDWPGKVLSSHKSASQLFHKLSLLADFGLTQDDKEIKLIVEKVKKHVSKEGLYRIATNIPTHFGGSGKDQWAWSLCDAPLILYSLFKFGYKDESMLKGVKYILSLTRSNGWPCKVSEELGSFRGPGRKDDACPFATLASLKMLTQIPEFKNSAEAKTGVEALLNLWENSKALHPYIFYMGNDFRKLKAPLFWYEILNVTAVLSQFEFVHKDKRYLDMLAVIKSKANSEGRYTPESVYREFKDFDFGQKKNPSRWLTLNVLKILKSSLQ